MACRCTVRPRCWGASVVQTCRATPWLPASVRVGQAVQPVINLLRDLALDAPLIYGDETEIQVLKEAGRTAQAKSYMWVQMAKRSGA